MVDEKEVEETYEEAVKKCGKLDATVNNAGIAGADKPTDELTEKEWDSVMNVNVKGVFSTPNMPFLTGENQGEDALLTILQNMEWSVPEKYLPIMLQKV